MGWQRGTLRQPFKVRVDVEKLVDFITDKIIEQIASDKEIDSVDLDEWYVDDNTLIIDGVYEASFRSIYSQATFWKPSEYDEERPYLGGGDDSWLLSGLPKEIRDLVNVVEIQEVDEDCKKDYGQDD